MLFRQHERTARQSTLHLLALFALVVVGLLLAVNAVLALIYWLMFPFARGFPTLFFETNTALVLLFVLGGCWIETMRLREGGAHVARLAGGREAQLSAGGELGQLERRFANVVYEMDIASGHPGLPAAWVLPKDNAINAFAAGWGDGDAVVAVTRGALERLTRAELQGVVAHEFSHLVHGDTRLNMRLVGMVWGLQMIWGLGVALWEPDNEGRRGAGTLFGLGLMAVGSLGWAAGRLLQAAVSRQREFLADASAVKYTRLVDGLGGALRKIADQQLHGRAGLHSAHATSLAHLLLSNRGAADGWRALWHTHPPLAERLRRLYGHEVLPLAADVVPIDSDEAEPVMHLAPALAPAAAARATSSATASAAALASELGPEAHRHDALQIPSSFDARAREQEALARIERWHGPGEWQAAMLALTLDLDAPQAAIGWAAWRNATADLSVAAAVQAEIEVLGPAARRHVFMTLMQRARSAPRPQRRALVRALRQRWAGLPARPAAQWRVLGLALLLGAARPPSPRSGQAGTLARHAGAAHAATALLVPALGAAPDASQAWHNAAAQALAEFGAPAPRGPAAGLAPAMPLRDLQRAMRVRHIAPMQRPLLLRAWLLAAEQSHLSEHAGTVDALHLACLLLDLPLPQSLAN
jgi:Zn-dependent protease with chaperone function